MYTYVKIPISNNFFSVAFPNKCVYCGLPAETKIVQPVNGQSNYEDNRGRFVTENYSTKLTIPFCKTHMKESKKNSIILNSINILAAIGLFLGLITGRLWFLVFLISPLLQPTDNFILTLGGLLIILMIGMGLVYVITVLAKYLLSFFVHTLRHQSGLGLLSSGVLGIKCTFTPKKDALLFRFVNAEFAREFSILNGQGEKGASSIK